MKKRILTILFIFLFLVVFAQAQTPPTKLKKNEVVLIVKIKLQPGIDEEFFRSYLKLIHTKERPTTAYLNVLGSTGLFAKTTQEIGPLNSFGYPTYDIPKNNTFSFNGFYIDIFNSFYLRMALPIGLQFTVPEDTPYVYLGTFTYKYSDDYFTGESFEIEDEFDEVLEELRKAIGPDVKLARAVLREYED